MSFLFQLLISLAHFAFLPASAVKDSRQLLVDILSDAAVGSSTCEQVRKLCHGIDVGTDHANFGIAELGKMDKTNFERDLHRWAKQQSWMHLLPELYAYPVQLLTCNARVWRRTAALFYPSA